MVGKNVVKTDEIQAYINAYSKIGCSLKQIFAEISVVYSSTNVSYDTVHRWKKKFNSGLELIKNALKSRRPKFCDEIISKVKEIVERDARYTVCVGILLSKVHFILNPCPAEYI